MYVNIYMTFSSCLIVTKPELRYFSKLNNIIFPIIWTFCKTISYQQRNAAALIHCCSTSSVNMWVLKVE
jgi:hypothetical protein